MSRNLAIRKTKHASGKVLLDRSIEEQYDLLDLEERLLQAGRGIVLTCGKALAGRFCFCSCAIIETGGRSRAKAS